MKVNNKRMRENAIIEAAASIIVNRRGREVAKPARRMHESELLRAKSSIYAPWYDQLHQKVLGEVYSSQGRATGKPICAGADLWRDGVDKITGEPLVFVYSADDNGDEKDLLGIYVIKGDSRNIRVVPWKHEKDYKRGDLSFGVMEDDVTEAEMEEIAPGYSQKGFKESRRRPSRRMREAEMTLDQKDVAFKKYVEEHPEVNGAILKNFNKELFKKEQAETTKKFNGLYRGIDTSKGLYNCEAYPSSDDWYAPFLPTTRDVIKKFHFEGESKFFEVAAQVIIDTIKLEICEGWIEDSMTDYLYSIGDSLRDMESAGFEATYSCGESKNMIPVNAVVLAAMYPIKTFENFVNLKEQEEDGDLDWDEFTDGVYQDTPDYAFLIELPVKDVKKLLSWMNHPTPFNVSMVSGD